MANLSLKSLDKRYGNVEALHGIDLDGTDGKFVVFVGPSGSDKSTIMWLIAGPEKIGGGGIEIGGRDVAHPEPNAPDIATVFQNHAAYPQTTVRKTFAIGLRSSKMPRADRETRIAEVAQIHDMTALPDCKPHQLSAGQRLRVANGRAMVRDLAVLIFDEPLSNLDAQLRTQMRRESRKLHRRARYTSVLVTHDPVAAMTMADRIGIMKDGRIQKVGTA